MIVTTHCWSSHFNCDIHMSRIIGGRGMSAFAAPPTRSTTSAGRSMWWSNTFFFSSGFQTSLRNGFWEFMFFFFGWVCGVMFKWNLSPTFSVVVQKRFLSSDRFNRKQDSGTIPLSMFISKLNNLYVHMLWVSFYDSFPFQLNWSNLKCFESS